MEVTSDIFQAVDNLDLEAVRRLVSDEPAKADARNPEGLSIVLYALYRGLDEIVEALLSAGPSLDVFDAAAVGRADRLGQLIDADPRLVEAYASDGFTALHLAVFFGREDATRLLLQRGGTVNAVARNEMRVMPLHSAVAGGHRGICELLLANGADVNARQQGGWTPLHGAAEHGDPALVAMLLAAGADRDARIDDGQTAADRAAASGHQQVAEQLRGATAFRS
jgi:uncharacterized protein